MSTLTHREKQILLGIGTVVVLTALLLIFAGKTEQTQDQAQTTERSGNVDESAEENQPGTLAEPAEESRSEIESQFPENFPFEQEAEEFQAFRATDPNSGETMYNFIYISQESMAENQARFETFFNTENFEIRQQTEEENSVFYSVRRGDTEKLGLTLEELDGELLVSGVYTQ